MTTCTTMQIHTSAYNELVAFTCFLCLDMHFARTDATFFRYKTRMHACMFRRLLCTDRCHVLQIQDKNARNLELRLCISKLDCVSQTWIVYLNPRFPYARLDTYVAQTCATSSTHERRRIHSLNHTRNLHTITNHRYQAHHLRLSRPRHSKHPIYGNIYHHSVSSGHAGVIRVQLLRIMAQKHRHTHADSRVRGIRQSRHTICDVVFCHKRRFCKHTHTARID